MRKPIIAGIAGAVALLMLYTLIVSLTESFSHTLQQFFSLWYLFLPLIIGFGVQIGLYTYLKHGLRRSGTATSAVSAAGGLSTTSMVACCAHHLTDVIPLLGLTAAAAFLSKYQTAFLVVGVLSNIVGLTIMLEAIQRNRLEGRSRILRALQRYNLSTAKVFIIPVALALAVISFASSPSSASSIVAQPVPQPPAQGMAAQTATADGITFTMQPTLTDAALSFAITIDTHQGSLDLDLTQAARVVERNGNTLAPLDWSGDPAGGHHRRGVLRFPKPSGGFTLNIQMRDQLLAFPWEV